MHIKVESFGKVVRTGVAKTSGHQYIFAEGYLMIEGSQYPERFEYYCATQDDVLPPGIWHVPVTVSLREGRLSFFPEYRQAQKAQTSASQQSQQQQRPASQVAPRSS